MVKKALIVDDQPFDVELTRSVLEACDDTFVITVAFDGAEALHELDKVRDFDVILLDLNLPKINGFEVLKELSSKPFLSDVPVIVMSASRNDSDRYRVRVMGVREFVEKTVDYSVFKQNLLLALTRDGFQRLH